MMNIDNKCLSLIKHLAIKKEVFAECEWVIKSSFDITGYTKIKYLGRVLDKEGGGRFRYECLNPYGRFWLVEYTLPKGWEDMSWECAEESPTWAGGDRTAIRSTPMRLSFEFDDDMHTMKLKSEVLGETVQSAPHGKKSFMGGWVE